jgi:hypothetical protein
MSLMSIIFGRVHWTITKKKTKYLSFVEKKKTKYLSFVDI